MYSIYVEITSLENIGSGLYAVHRKKKVHEFPVSSRDVTNQTPPGQEWFSYDVIIPAQGEFCSDILAGDGKLANLFFTVYVQILSRESGEEKPGAPTWQGASQLVLCLRLATT